MRFLSYLVTLIVASLIAACGGGGGSPGLTPGGAGSQAFFTTAPLDLTLTTGSAQNFAVGGGKAPFTATSNNSGVAVSSLSDTVLTLGAVSPGSATVTLRDAAGATVAVAVTVKPSRGLFTTAPPAVTIAMGNNAAHTYQVGGGVGPYVVGNSNPSVLSAVLNGTNLTLTGLASGAANLVILDSVGGSLSVAVTIPNVAALDLFTTAPPAVTTSRGTSTTYGIGGGVSPYIVTSSNTGVVSVTQTATSFTIHGVANGTANLVVRDSAGRTVSVAVTVSAQQLSVNPVSVNAFIGDTVYSTISGGTAPYSIVEGFPDAADTDVGFLNGTTFSPTASGNVLRVVVKQVVATDVILVKDANGNAVSFTLTGTAGTNIISLAPESLTIGEEFTGPIRLVLRGAVGTTNIFSSNPDMIIATTPVTGTVAGTEVTITKTGFQICANGEVTISAIDSQGSKAVSLITVEDHGNNPDPCPPVAPTP